MRLKTIVLPILLALTTALSLLPGCEAVEADENYLAMVPKTLYSGSTEAVSLALFRGNNPISGRVEAVLLKDNKVVTTSRTDINGSGMLSLNIPDVAEGTYEIRLKGKGFEATTAVQIERSFLVFLETDKPIYKPGQTIYMRVMALDAELKPAVEQVTVEVQDAKGNKVFRSEVITDEFGMASLELPVSSEPNLGVWKISASTPKNDTQLDVRVEEYVLPKYEVKVNLVREWFLVSEKIKGIIAAEYSFGKPVLGELEIRASRYVGEWQEYATVTKAIDGEADFEIPAAGYVAGVPAAGGSGNVMIAVTVREKSTDYEEKTSRLLTVAQSEIVIQLIPEGSVFKPGLPFNILVVTETPANSPVDASAQVTVTYLDKSYGKISEEQRTIKTSKGKAVVEITPPEQSVAMVVEAFELTPVSSRPPAQTSLTLTSSYSPSGNFIHLEQITEGVPETGQVIRFRVYSTRQAANFYYEIISRGKVVLSDFTKDQEIEIKTTPLMSPTSRVVVYQILPNSEVAADYLPFDVAASYPHDVSAQFSETEARPGDKLSINIRTQGEAKVGIAAVDRSVFILAENRVNLQQVFDELERLYMTPQVELHEASIYPAIETKGAKEIFDDAGVTILTNTKVPEGKDYRFEERSGVWDKVWRFLNGGRQGGIMLAEDGKAFEAAMPTTVPPPVAIGGASELAEVQRIRQFFPETWLWDTRIVGANGRMSVPAEVPDTITTWMLRAVAISKEKGLGVAEDELRVFQPFFLTIDLPYSAIRGEEFPVSVAIYNYLDSAQTVVVSIEDADWFELLDDAEKTIEIKANDIGGAAFTIRPARLGNNPVKITVRSSEAADAVIKTVIIEPEGVARETVQNLTLGDGFTETVDTSLPVPIVDGSGRVYIALTSSYLAQTLEGLEGLIQMPFGCGEQNMILLAPDIFITRYLVETGQLKTEIMAKAEKLMITGYQRELTYRRGDGSFSAFGESDEQGSLWLTAFVLKTFSQAKDIIYVDDAVLNAAARWITGQQNSDGSFDPVGFVHHQEMIGGVEGETALTAYVATALLEAGETASGNKAVTYLEGQLEQLDDPYTMAVTAYALELAGSGKAGEAYDKLMGMAVEDEDGLHWGSNTIVPSDTQGKVQPGIRMPVDVNRTTEVEATAYATLALIKHGDAFNSSRAAKWLVSRRNAYGGYGSTQDTVVTLQALTEYATDTRADVDLTVMVKGSDFEKSIRITQQNYDVLQIVEIDPNQQIEISASGKGEVIGQVVSRYNISAAEKPEDDILSVDVDYDATQIEVDDLINISVKLAFNPPIPMEAGMVVLDVSVPTGFIPVTDTIVQAMDREVSIKRYDIAGRKVIFYIENMQPGDEITFNFKARALYPVKAKGVASVAYSYYKPEIRGETLSGDVTVR